MVLHHTVRVFVFRFEERQPRFLLLRHEPRHENALGPVQGLVGIAEHLEEAVMREVAEETGLRRPSHLIDLEHYERLIVGDEGVVAWEFGYETAHSAREPLIVPGPKIVESIWAGFDEAFHTLEMPADRDALVRLQMRIGA